MTPGGIAGLYVAALALCNPGDEILVPDPGWPNYHVIAGAQHLTVGSYPMAPDGGPRAELIEPQVGPRTKELVVNSPANPSGAVIGTGRLAEIVVALTRERDLWIISDEVYDELTFEEAGASTASVGDPERVATVFSFSKSYSMTGWRIGYVVAPKEIATMIARIHPATGTCASAPVQHAGVAALGGAVRLPHHHPTHVPRTARPRSGDPPRRGCPRDCPARRVLHLGRRVRIRAGRGDVRFPRPRQRGRRRPWFRVRQGRPGPCPPLVGRSLERLEVGASRLAELVHDWGST